MSDAAFAAKSTQYITLLRIEARAKAVMSASLLPMAGGKTDQRESSEGCTGKLKVPHR